MWHAGPNAHLWQEALRVDVGLCECLGQAALPGQQRTQRAAKQQDIGCKAGTMGGAFSLRLPQ